MSDEIKGQLDMFNLDNIDEANEESLENNIEANQVKNNKVKEDSTEESLENNNQVEEDSRIDLIEKELQDLKKIVLELSSNKNSDDRLIKYKDLVVKTYKIDRELEKRMKAIQQNKFVDYSLQDIVNNAIALFLNQYE